MEHLFCSCVCLQKQTFKHTLFRLAQLHKFSHIHHQSCRRIFPACSLLSPGAWRSCVEDVAQ